LQRNRIKLKEQLGLVVKRRFARHSDPENYADGSVSFWWSQP
jgi:hypothetical protein